MDLRADPLVRRLAAAVRDAIGHNPDQPWEALRRVEAPALEAPAAVGGFDLGLTCGIVVSAELGRRASPDVYGAVPMAVESLLAADGDHRAAAALAGGERPVVSAGLDAAVPGGRPAPRAERTAAGWSLTGAVPAPDGAPPGADLCVPVRTGEGVRLALLPAAAWSERAAGERVDLAGIELPGDALGGGLDPADQAGPLARARVRHAGRLLGLGEGALGLAADHAAARKQFGTALLGFQGVAFPLAKAEIDLAAARLMTARAGWLADAGRPFGTAAAEALALAAEAALTAVRTALQVHGARGMSREAEVSRYLPAVRRAVAHLGPVGALWREAGRHRLAERRAAEAAPAEGE
ncbi:acyl-CoA dehydrogenase [Allonocardiopsis opalescens]|uniref:Alkylation response protein AidB-like acyl-CoA dehydrogenase n=1 Tax=Allonocardiopsis opalescens TaxID=1144618 RepID=A0A2T0PYC0_9ACTN|nr:acyl-CoA dehydrogenase [Allonocardiopsis opalescens]PRX96512.1 alkylation response protein AidB-like acyl-CoA dehydrogenase [Allonocardiopsis opalescens]